MRDRSTAPHRYVVIEGPGGVGKTALAQKLAEHWNAEFLGDPIDDNPFLPRFFADPTRHALATQLSFLLQRVKLLETRAQLDLFRTQLVSDFLLEKDALFAELLLSPDEFELYRTLYQKVAAQTPTPDLVIYLQASPNWLVEHARRHDYRHLPQLGDGLLKRLATAYSDFFYRYDAAPLLIVNIEHLAPVRDDDFALLLRRINGMRGTREFFNKGD